MTTRVIQSTCGCLPKTDFHGNGQTLSLAAQCVAARDQLGEDAFTLAGQLLSQVFSVPANPGKLGLLFLSRDTQTGGIAVRVEEKRPLFLTEQVEFTLQAFEPMLGYEA